MLDEFDDDLELEDLPEGGAHELARSRSKSVRARFSK